MVYNVAGTFLGTALGNILADLNKLPDSQKPNVLVVPSLDNEVIKKFTPISRYDGYITCGADANFFTDYILPINQTPCLFRIQIALSVAGVFKAVYRQGSDVAVYSFNAGAGLVASSLYIFDCLVSPNDQLNFRSSLAGVANIRIQEIALAIQ